MTWKLLTTKASPFTADADFALTQAAPDHKQAIDRFSTGAKTQYVAFLVLFFEDDAIVTADKGSFTLDVCDVSYVPGRVVPVVSSAQTFTSATADVQYVVDAAKLRGEMCVSLRSITPATDATSMAVYYKEW